MAQVQQARRAGRESAARLLRGGHRARIGALSAPHQTRVGLLGGSFNPPHVCHVLSSVYWLETGGLDAIWWLPVHEHAFAKGRTLAPWADRLAMCEAVAAEHPGIFVDPIEASLPSPSRTIRTVEALQAAHPHTEFSWIIGSDLLHQLPTWLRWEELRDRVTFCVLGRGGHDHPLPEGRFDVRDFTLPDVSSRAIRRDLGAGQDADDRLPKGVARWLKSNRNPYR